MASNRLKAHERGTALAVELGTFNANFFVFDFRSIATIFLARALWLRGFSDQALRFVRRAIDEAESRDHPVPICISLVYASTLLLWTGDLPGASDLIETTVSAPSGERLGVRGRDRPAFADRAVHKSLLLAA